MTSQLKKEKTLTLRRIIIFAEIFVRGMSNFETKPSFRRHFKRGVWLKIDCERMDDYLFYVTNLD